MTIKITYGTVAAAAEDIRSAAKDLKSQLEALNARVNSVVQTWDGEARDAYRSKHQGWDTNVQGLSDTLNAIARALDGATAGYQQTDRKAAQQFQF
ncbi:WXG100 family type VII secretion target [Streptomyces megasporus]|uniref:WXG100 family type VII secretion target n=1 Tax=Streptomyces megasporus TaxID=44060 RepID=UPI0004E1623A|nr:WXG100 family type VII secretion target [Streptomyces megasporus]